MFGLAGGRSGFQRRDAGSAAPTVNPALQSEPPSADGTRRGHAETALLIEAVDRLLLEDGELDMLRLLQRLGLPDTAPALANRLLEFAESYCRQQGFEAVTHTAAPTAAAVSSLAERELAARCGIVMRRSETVAQFDLFHDSRSAYAEAAVRDALLDHRLDEARAALQRCDETTAAQLSRLIEAAASPPASTERRIVWLDREITPLAQRRLGSAAKTYLAGLWSDFAAQLDGSAFDPDRPLEHASHAWLRAGRGERACACIEQEASWQQQPALLARMARARSQSKRQNQARLAWMQLCWRYPGAAETALNEDPAEFALAIHWNNFRFAELEFAVADFPAWMLVADHRHLEFVPVSAAPSFVARASAAARSMI